MKNVRKMLDKLWIIFAMVGTVSAMDIAPFYFEHASGLDPESQEAEWDYLMKYKMFGASGIDFENGNIKFFDAKGVEYFLYIDPLDDEDRKRYEIDGTVGTGTFCSIFVEWVIGDSPFIPI